MDPKAYWVGFNYIKGIGAVRLQGILKAFNNDLISAWNAPQRELLEAKINPRIAENILHMRGSINLEKIWEYIQRSNIQVLIWDDPEYPALLREIEQAPPVLYVKGELLPEDEIAAAVVGTRRISGYGRQVTEDITSSLVRNGVTIISGLARGTDAIAHKAALQAGGRTLAVLGSGVDRIYPPEHRNLADEIIQSGALISDYPPGTPPESSNFPPRNRIISGLALATIVIEAGETSGATITAAYAAEQGREVLALPGNITSPNSIGTNRLIQNGARPLLKLEDVLDAMNIHQVNTQRVARRILPEDETEIRILDILSNGVLSVDEISFLTGLPIEKISATLAVMELKGYVGNTGGMNYRAIREETDSYFAGKND